MHLRRVEITNLRIVRSLRWSVEHLDRKAGWHVFLGPNGSGKSTLLRAIAWVLVGQTESAALRLTLSDWLGSKGEHGCCELLVGGDGKPWDLGRPGNEPLGLDITITQDDGRTTLSGSSDLHPLARSGGWFSASYGPLRRFRGGDQEAERTLRHFPRLARHLTIFGEDYALSECLSWLRDLRFKQLEAEHAGKADGGESGRLLVRVFSFVNQAEFLPYGARLSEISSERVTFHDGDGNAIDILELSDGYRSVLSLTFELIRQLAAAYDPDILFDPADPTRIVAPGVVLIDEIDAHLHPSWQARIGTWLTCSFPHMQFLVTTHSPLVCHAAVQGSVYRLPRPGSDEEGRMVVGDELHSLLYGDVLDAYETESFGVLSTRSVVGEAKLRRLAELNVKRLDEGLSPAEELERGELRRALPVHQNDLLEDIET
jgi:energy-coupling factor transporter ATP-binding protein EcfA2